MFLGANPKKLQAMADKLTKFAGKLDTVRKILEVIVFASIFFGPFGGAIRAVLKVVIRGLQFLSKAARLAAGVLSGQLLQQIGASAAGALAASYVPPTLLPPETTEKIVKRVTEGVMSGDYKGIYEKVLGDVATPISVGNTGITIGPNGVNLPMPVGNGNPGGPFGTPPINGAIVPTGSITIGPKGQIIFNNPTPPVTTGAGVIPGITPGTTPTTFPTETFKGAQPVLGTGPVLDEKAENAKHLVIRGGSTVPVEPRYTTRSSIDPNR
ncbi:MAG TPA: hypothetical protein VFC00_16975 [Micromonosporaceae bacterium]|nr:hypothetical protein [Micromonosporaceae bacterium]